MTNKQMGQGSWTVLRPLVALALSLAATSAAWAQENGTPTPAPSSTRPIDFRLPPSNDGRTPGVQGPADNGLPPVTPGERQGPQPTPAPAPTPPRVPPTQPAATRSAPTPTPTAPARRDTAASTAVRAAPLPDGAQTPQPTTTDGATAAPPASGATDAAAPTATATTATAADDVPAAATPAGTGAAIPLWAWLLAALAAVGAGFWYWRRTALAGAAAEEVDDAPHAPEPPAAPTKPAVPSPAPAPAPTQPVLRDEPRPASPLVTRAAGERRALVGMALEVRGIRFAPDHIVVGFALNLTNQGTLPATGLMVRIALNQGSAMTEPVLGRFFDGAGGSVLRDDMVLEVGAGEELSTEVMLPRAAIEPLMIGGKPMLVPVIAFDVTYHWDGEGEAFGQNAGSFVLGRAPASGAGDKLAPLPLDRSSYAVDRPGARSTAIRRNL
jgi:hypothetical protein